MVDSSTAQAALRSGSAGVVYDEGTFRYFLAVDRSRAYRSRRFLYLVLVAMRANLDGRARLTEAAAAAVFRALNASVREIDFVGWYHENKVAGAVLVQGAKTAADAAAVISGRVLRGLREHVPPAQATKLRVRVVRLGNKTVTSPSPAR
jgi:hypothetical protein